MKSVLALLILILSLSASAGEPITFVPSFGNTGSAGHHLNPALLDRGHVASRERMERAYQAGSRRFMAHLPFGRDQSKFFVTDTLDALQSPDPRVRMAALSFVPQMAVFLHQHPDATLYVYLGSPHLDGVFRVTGQVDPDEQAQLWTDSIAPVLELSYLYPGRIGLALDHAHVIKPDDPVAKLLLVTHRQLGLPLMVEGGVSVQSWQADAGFSRMMIWSSFKDRLEKPLDSWPGEQVLIPNGAARFDRAPDNWLRFIQELGFTGCGY